ncbi:hypothetical protein Cni_G03157 [Canna indica]|uniref:Pollen Ole e 1 allergen and extensin family protein n=1 Tax=Canna indica TaxID=4628 RepID=A0AAQ3Q0V8_9LILI|nr:hypothetical protein Cni_G03157 [Canna indica]
MLQPQHESQSASVVLLLALLFMCSTFVSWAAAAALSEGAAMQLSRAELVRVAGYGDERLSTVLVTGTLLCSACMKQSSGGGLITFHVPGAKIGVACKLNGRRKEVSWAYGTTDEYGEFIVDLPSHLHAIRSLEEACLLRVLRIPTDSNCDLVSGIRYTSKRIRLTSTSVGDQGIRVYTTETLILSGKTRHFQECLKMSDE